MIKLNVIIRFPKKINMQIYLLNKWRKKYKILPFEDDDERRKLEWNEFFWYEIHLIEMREIKINFLSVIWIINHLKKH